MGADSDFCDDGTHVCFRLQTPNLLQHMVGDLVGQSPGQLLCDAFVHQGVVQSAPERYLFLLLHSLSYLLRLANDLLEDHKRIPQFIQLQRIKAMSSKKKKSARQL